MQSRGKVGTMGRWAAIIVTLLAMSVFPVPATHAADEVAGRNVGHTQETEMAEVGDVPGHFMGFNRYHGLSFYTKGPDAGEIVPRAGVLSFDVVKGKGTITGYEVKTFRDGSTLALKFKGAQEPLDGGKRTAYDGTWEVAGGTGKYEGARGTGTFKGERIGDSKTGGDNYSDFAGTVVKK